MGVWCDFLAPKLNCCNFAFSTYRFGRGSQDLVLEGQISIVLGLFGVLNTHRQRMNTAFLIPISRQRLLI